LCLLFKLISAQKKADPTPEESARESVISFSVLYSLTVAASVVVFFLQRRAIKPVVEAHAARESTTDFAAVQNFSRYFNIAERLNTAVPSNERILWEDVSLTIAPLSHLLGTLCIFVLGFVLVGTTAGSTAQLGLVPLLLLLLFAGFSYVGMGLKQVIGKQHFKDLYAFTENRIIIINFSHLNCRKPEIEYIAYYDVVDVKLIYDAHDQVGSVSFQKRETKEESLLGKSRLGPIGQKWFNPNYRKLHNIVNPREVERLLLNNIAEHGKGKQTVGGYQDITI